MHQDASAYTKAGLDITFRPHEDKFEKGASRPQSTTFFPTANWRTEQEQRNDLMKWETVLHATNKFYGSTLKGGPHSIFSTTLARVQRQRALQMLP